MIKTVLTYSDAINALHAGLDRLWIAHQGGLTAFDPARGDVHKWTTADGLPALPVVHVTTSADAVAVATPNGVAWCDAALALGRGESRRRWESGLARADGAGVFAHAVSFVQGRLYAASGGGRLYRRGGTAFERIDLPLGQARLTRLVPLIADEHTLRLAVLTNNSGVLMISTGGGAEPSIYQWAEDEGLASRYATAIAVAAGKVVVAVRGGVHTAPIASLVEAPDRLNRWGVVRLHENAPPAEGTRVAALCEHEGFLWIATAMGLHRVPLAALAATAGDDIEAERVDDVPVRHLQSYAGELWIVQGTMLGRWGPRAVSAAPAAAGSVTAGSATASLRTRFFRVRAPRVTESAPVLASLPARARFTADSRWSEPGTAPEIRRANVLAASPDGLAVGGEAGRVAFLRDERWTTETVARLRRSPEIHALAWDPDNAGFWAATRAALYQRDPRGRWHRDATFPGRSVHALCAWAGSVAALGPSGLHLYVQGAWSEVRFGVERPGLITGTASDGALAVWGRTGLFVWRAGTARPEPIAGDVGRATCMAWGDADDLWVGTDRGLVHWQDARSTHYAWSDERRDRVTALLVHRGSLLIGSHAGLLVVPEPQARRAADGAALEEFGRRFGVLDGLPDAQVTAAVAHASRVWIGTVAGLARLE